jgi:transcriptional regulator with XRE-family HTH domain
MLRCYIDSKEEHNKRFSENLVQIMKQKNIGTTELAKLTHKNKQTINDYLKGNKNPSSFFIRELAKGLNISHLELHDF